MRIIAAIDIAEGECVRLTRGDFGTVKVYDRDPVEAACRLEDHGLKYLHLVDLDGAKKGKTVNLRILRKMTQKTSLSIDYSGGIRTTEDIGQVFDLSLIHISEPTRPY
jgi:phosphoribosylformimino-5-aminoimidazole carboxamide ribotide isomerase